MNLKHSSLVVLFLVIGFRLRNFNTVLGSPSPAPGDNKSRSIADTAEPPDEYIGPILKCRNGGDDVINKCLRRILADLKPRLAKGIPEIGLEPLDPFYLDQIKFKQGHGTIIIEALLTNNTILHLADFTKAEFKIQSKNQILTFDLEAPKVRIDGKYNLGGRLLLFPIGGSGPYFFEIGNVKVKGYAHLGEQKTSNGTRILQVDKIILDLQIKQLKVKLVNLFNGNPVLEPVINNVLNENAFELFDEIKPEIIKIIQDIVKNIANRIIGNMPFLVDYIEHK